MLMVVRNQPQEEGGGGGSHRHIYAGDSSLCQFSVPSNREESRAVECKNKYKKGIQHKLSSFQQQLSALIPHIFPKDIVVLSSVFLSTRRRSPYIQRDDSILPVHTLHSRRSQSQSSLSGNQCYLSTYGYRSRVFGQFHIFIFLTRTESFFTLLSLDFICQYRGASAVYCMYVSGQAGL